MHSLAKLQKVILEIFFVNKNIKIDAFLCIKKNNFFHKLEFTNVTIYSLGQQQQDFRFFSHGEGGVQTWHRSMEEENNLFLLFGRFTYFWIFVTISGATMPATSKNYVKKITIKFINCDIFGTPFFVSSTEKQQSHSIGLTVHGVNCRLSVISVTVATYKSLTDMGS